MTFKLYIGDIYQDLADTAKSKDPTAFLIDHTNYKEFLNKLPDHDITAYTSLGDLSEDLATIYQLLDCADEIYYCAPAKWSDGKTLDVDFPDQSVHGLTEIILYYFHNHKKNVHNFSLDNYSDTQYLSLVAERKTDSPQLWSAGPSVTNGVGVAPEECYSAILGKLLDMEVSYVTSRGSSISWTADQLLRSDIRANDIVVWAVPDYCRFSVWSTKTQQVNHILPSWREDTKINLDIPNRVIDTLLLDDTRFYEAITHVHQIILHCRQISAKLLLTGFGATFINRLYLHLHKIPEFKIFQNKNFSLNFIDLGNDNRHPGPQQHKHYADFCINALKNLNYI